MFEDYDLIREGSSYWCQSKYSVLTGVYRLNKLSDFKHGDKIIFNSSILNLVISGNIKIRNNINESSEFFYVRQLEIL